MNATDNASTGARVLTIRQPYADLIMAGVKDVENRTWRVPSTLPQWQHCFECGTRWRDARWEDVCLHCGDPDASVPDGPFPFRVWIHAGREIAEGAGPETWPVYPVNWHKHPLPKVYALGSLLGSVAVTGCHHADECRDVEGSLGYRWRETWCSPWAEPDVWHWTLEDPRPLDEPVPMRGRQGLWTLPNDIAVPV